MNFAIIRIQKLKSAVAVRRSLKHAFREQDTPNADPERAQQNTHFGAHSAADAIQKFNYNMPDKVRSNAVVCVEFLVTASPEKMKSMTSQEQNKYFSDALAFIQAKHGAENVFYAGIHRDESTPHMYCYVTPIKDGKLNCRAFYGENGALSKMQSDFAETVGKKHTLSRGIKGSKAKHTTIKKFYADLNREPVKIPSIGQVELPETKMLESKADYAMRSISEYRKKFDPALTLLARQASLNATHEKTATEAKKAALVAQLEAEKQRLLAQKLQQVTDEKIQQVKKLLFLPDDQLLEARKNLFRQDTAEVKAEKSKIEAQQKPKIQRM
jgi:hypothetical protein